MRKLDCLFFELSRSDFLELVYEYATKNNIARPFKNCKDVDDWFSGLHPEIVLKYRSQHLWQERNVSTDRRWSYFIPIYNMDETGIKRSTTKPPKVLSIKRKQQVDVISSAERG